MNNDRKRNVNKGFTLVELIVVLVILAILAALLVPTLLGYIDRARQKKDINRARACLDAAQAAFVEAYGLGSPASNKNVAGITESNRVNGYSDINCVGTDFANKILNYVDDDPYIFLVATGDSNQPDKVSAHEMYTVCYACFIPEKDSRPYYFYNGEWTTENGANVNAIKKDEGAKTNTLGTLPIQYYIICNKDNRSLSGLDEKSFWGYLRIYLPKKYGDTPK